MPTQFPTVPGPPGFPLLRACASAAAALLPILPCAAQPVRNQFTEGNQSLLVEFPNGSQPRYAFHPVKITAVNSGTEPVAWEVRIRDEGMNERTLNHAGHRERIVIPPRRTVERELLVAMGRRDQHSWSYRQVVVIMPSGQNSMWNPNSSGRTDLAGVSVPALLTPQSKQLISNAPEQNDDFHGRMDPASAPGDWRGYAAFALILLTPDDWQAMPVAARTAVGDWVRMGGHLQFVGGMPDDAPSPDSPGRTSRGLGDVHPPPASDGAGRPMFRHLPGALASMKSKPPATESMDSGGSLLTSWLQRKQPDLLRERFTIWPMVLVLIAFFVMITPVNLFVLAPSRRRHRLFRTIPLISLSACVLLALAVGLGDGTGGRGERLVWIESRPGTENRQFITQWQASRCGALIGTGFTVPDAAFLSPLRDPGSSVTLRVGGDRLEAGGGWFTSRATQSHFLQTARPGRGRIEWSAKDAGEPSAVSTFDFPLRDVYVLQQDGTWWHAPAMRQGETTSLEQVGSKQVNDVINASIHGFPQESDIRSMAHRPGHFIAFTDKPPAIESLRSVRWNDTGIVTGSIANP